ncbi:hypothetical protein [Caulobacter mirabilis]|uniref:SH3b domain-containing protein n=1 Tax=Caulobacter mirabilis TaxID=69666 RepID=A0A2D2AUH3_9CAUL|nr:hypothetical protein [Caulobacter mirabilis]ATQ41641.1 hypothetical protein CSW64_04035 [Caulobacter mirabilis]
MRTRMAGLCGAMAVAAALSGCGGEGAADRAEPAAEAKPAEPPFGQTAAERRRAEAERRKAGLGTYWVKTDVATEHESPGGKVVNRIYYGQKLTVFEKRGDWYRTVEDGFVARWTRASQLTDREPPAKPAYAGPDGAVDPRIAKDAIPNPGEYGLTKADVDILHRGARRVLDTRPDCEGIESADKSVNKPDTYYVTCRIRGSVENVFFTKAEVASR